MAPQTGLRISEGSDVKELRLAGRDQRIVEDGCTGYADRSGRSARLSVGVIVDLFQSPAAGGHVKTWEKLAQAACGEPLDLTVYFLGAEAKVVPLAENVRYVHVRPVWSTESLAFLRGIPAHTDLAPLHFGALGRFSRHHVLHATDAYFSMARAARLLTRWSSCALVHSTHTDTPGYTRIYADQALRRACGDGRVARMLCDRWKMPERIGKRMQRRLERYLRQCDWALAPNENAIRQLSSAIGAERTSLLRRGIDAELFHPARRDRARLEKSFGVARDAAVLLFAGRIDGGKEVLTLARAARILLDHKLSVHVICAGEGSQTQRVRELLGERVSLPGQVSQDELAWLYASADLFVFCSQIEVFPNVVAEAKACGLPVVVSAQGGSARLVRDSGDRSEADGVAVAGNAPEDWAREIEALLDAPQRRRAMGEAARRFVEQNWPTWRQVLREDLLPVWQLVARERGLAA